MKDKNRREKGERRENEWGIKGAHGEAGLEGFGSSEAHSTEIG